MYQEVNLNNTFKLKNDVIINTIKDYPSDYKINKDILISKNFKHFLERTLIEQDDFEKNFRLKYRRDISVNFDRIPEPNSLSIEIDNPRLHSVIQELAANCCRILGLNSSNRIVVKSTKLRSGLNGTFNLTYDMSGTVTISEDIMKSASITKEGFMQLVSTLAHEMYHARQAMLFPSFFANRMSKYITSKY